ncbi:AI-2E family transporter [Streptacidiphilus neutrinimicus]|uniref:AI-2E family transporter n=1 Tax=Streptacidiphilus neutrinimicus TaxID=105420 RepID=UPI0006932A84|nr:AI-2E family transporter [Streptacidiphilus neutrinimicus]
MFRLAEDYLITPKAMALAVRVHPLVTILAVPAGGALLGPTGAVLALPVAIAVGVLEEVVSPRIQAR